MVPGLFGNYKKNNQKLPNKPGTIGNLGSLRGGQKWN